MKAEETRKRLIQELEAQFNGTSAVSTMSFSNISYDKPKMFEPCAIKATNLNTDISSIKGMAFGDSKLSKSNSKSANAEIYDIQKLISDSPENMSTLLYDEKVLSAQLALVKKKDWQDVLFSDVDLFKPINLGIGIKKLFK